MKILTILGLQEERLVRLTINEPCHAALRQAINWQTKMTSALAVTMDKRKTTNQASSKALVKAVAIKVRVIKITVIRKTTTSVARPQTAVNTNLTIVMLETTATHIRTKKDDCLYINRIRIATLFRSTNPPALPTTTRISDVQAVCNHRPHKRAGHNIAQTRTTRTAAVVIKVRSQPRR